MMIFRKGFLILLLVVAAVTFGTLALAGDPLFSSALRRFGPTAIGQPLDFSKAELSILKGRAGITDLEIGAGQDPFAQVGRFAFDASAFDLIAGRLHIEEALLGQASLRLEIDENGKFIFDPGPPPADVEGKPDAPGDPSSDAEEVPAEDRDLVQIAEELWERYNTYSDYYDEYGGVFSGDEDEAVEVQRSRSQWPGKPEYLEGRASDADVSGFWLAHADIADLSWTTLDRRTGKAILPDIESGTLRLSNLGKFPGAAADQPGPPLIQAQTNFVQGGGRMAMTLEMPSATSNWTKLDLQLEDLPSDTVRAVFEKSLPFQLEGGRFDLLTEGLQFADSALQGVVRIELRGAKLGAKPRSPEVLGVKASEFARVMNRALESNPISFEFKLGGTPTDPKFSLQNATRLDDLVVDALRAEAEDRIQQEVDEKTNELTEKVKEELGGKASEALGGEAGELLEKGASELGGLFGGKKKDKKKKGDG